MYSIIDSCDETSGWHLVGLCNINETALSFVAQTSPCESRGNLDTVSPAGLNILRCHKALLHAVDCTTEHCQEREFFFSCQDCAWLHYVRRALPFTDFMSIQKKIQTRMKHEASAAERGFNTQCSTAGFSLSPAKRNNLLEHSQALNTVWEMYVVWDWCLLLQISPLWKGCLICDVLYKSSSFTHHLLNSKATSTQRLSVLRSVHRFLTSNVHVLFSERKLLPTWTVKNMQIL